jgi:hypothetical protein
MVLVSGIPDKELVSGKLGRLDMVPASDIPCRALVSDRKLALDIQWVPDTQPVLDMALVLDIPDKESA